MAEYVIRFQGFASKPPFGIRTPQVGEYLMLYVPEANGGYGMVGWSTDLADAMRFRSVTAALECWQQVPTNHPVRSSDLKPNRPLTAYTVAIEPVPEQP